MIFHLYALICYLAFFWYVVGILSIVVVDDVVIFPLIFLESLFFLARCLIAVAVDVVRRW